MLNVIKFDFYNVFFSFAKARIREYISKFTFKIVIIIRDISRENRRRRNTRREPATCYNRWVVMWIRWCTTYAEKFAHIAIIQQVTHFVIIKLGKLTYWQQTILWILREISISSSMSVPNFEGRFQTLLIIKCFFDRRPFQLLSKLFPKVPEWYRISLFLRLFH